MKALEKLRVQLVKDYPGDSPTFSRGSLPKESEAFFQNIVLPAFEKIRKEFNAFHFNVAVRKFVHVVRLEVKDGCSFFCLSIKTNKLNFGVILTVSYHDHSICSYNYEDRLLLEERFDLSKIRQALPEELIITIFSDTFINRKTYLKRIVETEENEARELIELEREERRAKLLKLRQENDDLDLDARMQKYLDVPQYSDLVYWVTMFYDLEFGDRRFP